MIKYTKNKDGSFTKTFTEIVRNVEAEINALEQHKINIDRGTRDADGEKTKQDTSVEDALIAEIDEALIILKE